VRSDYVVTSPNVNLAVVFVGVSGSLTAGAILGVWETGSTNTAWSVTTYIVLVTLAVVTYAWTRDAFSPLFLVLLVLSVRFLLPAALDPAGGELRIPLFRLMGLTSSDWSNGHSLALFGILAFAAGWACGPARSVPWETIETTPDVNLFWPSLLCAIVGFVSLGLFVQSNVSIGAALSTGEFRGTAIREGTGLFFYLGLASIPGAVGLSFALLGSGKRHLTSLLPVLVAAAIYFVLGGRARAATPALIGLLGWWYVRRSTRGAVRPRVLHAAVGAGLITLCAVTFLYVGALYRGGAGVSALNHIFDIGLVRAYIPDALLVDTGQLHALAASTALGPGVLHGATFVGSLTWPLSQFLPLSGRSAGIYILQASTGIRTISFGLLPSLIGDAYLNFGPFWVAVLMGVAGYLANAIYLRFREGRMSLATYCLVMVYGLRIVGESIEKWPEMLVVLLCWGAIGRVGRVLGARARPPEGNRLA
jgi:oligosaccharide repeat unit polymerase